MLILQWLPLILYAAWALMFIAGCTAFYFALISISKKPPRWPYGEQTGARYPETVLKWLGNLFLVPSDSRRLEEKRQLLAGAGFLWRVSAYETVRRAGFLLSATLLLLGYFGIAHPQLILWLYPAYIFAAGGSLAVFTAFDRKMLEQMKQRRSHQIVKEIYVISSQLLYYTGSKMSLHGKLMHCVPQTRFIRAAMRMMLAEWYQDAEEAIQQFQRRLGTEEARSFTETIRTLRRHEHEVYYDLLRQRAQDYKEKLELAKEGRKETVSYVLFTLAGLPILNTFRVFMYPWVMEGQKLFQSLN